MLGGDTTTVVRSFPTPKAVSVFGELSPGTDIRDVLPRAGDRVTLMSDGSPFYIFEPGGPWRVVLCVAHGYEVTAGIFAAVNVQVRKRKQ